MAKAWVIEYTDEFGEWFERCGRVMAEKWQELKDRTMSPERQEKARERAEATLAEMLLHEIREARGLSQEEVAKRLERRQPTVVGLEKRADTQVSTLRRYVEALGGELEIVARFPDADIRIKQFA